MYIRLGCRDCRERGLSLIRPPSRVGRLFWLKLPAGVTNAAEQTPPLWRKCVCALNTYPRLSSSNVHVWRCCSGRGGVFGSTARRLPARLYKSTGSVYSGRHYQTLTRLSRAPFCCSVFHRGTSNKSSVF